MIALLTGTPLFHGHTCIIMCGGVGYGVAVNEHTTQRLRTTQQETTLFIHTHVREDALELFGFQTGDELEWFKTLLNISGVGPKTALTITNAQPAQLRQAVEQGDVGFFSSFPRVGKKLAQKIIIELKPKLGSLQDLDLSNPTGVAREVREALQSLGYTDSDIHKALQHINTEEVSLQDAIKASIKFLSKS